MLTDTNPRNFLWTKRPTALRQQRPVQSVFIRFDCLAIGKWAVRHVVLQSSARSRDSISDKCCSRGACSVRLQSAPLGTRCKAKALLDGIADWRSPLPSDTESHACETTPHSVFSLERTPRLSVRKPSPHLLSLITRYVTIIQRESPAGTGKVIRLLSTRRALTS